MPNSEILIYEDQDLLVLNKPSGLPSAPLPKNPDERTAVRLAIEIFPDLPSRFSSDSIEPGLLHRLDTGTSGLLAFAKHPEAFHHFKSNWKSDETRKIYRAIAPRPADLNDPLLKQTLTPLLAHDAKSSKRMRAFLGPKPTIKVRGKPLPTWTQIESITSLEDIDLHADWEVQIRTGVMHQIRCTLAWLKSPILGDTIYRGAASSRLWLHAWRLQILSKNGQILRFEAPLPEDWPRSSFRTASASLR